MAYKLYSELGWLPKPPLGFRERCRELSSAAEAGSAIARLAAYSLDENQLRQLARAIGAARQQGLLASLAPFRLGLVGNGTLDYLAPLLEASAARHGVALECVQADFGQIAQEALVADSRINRARPDAVLLAIDARGLPLQPGTDEAAAADGVAASIAFIETLRASFHQHANALCIVQTLAPAPETLFGSFERRFAGTPLAVAEAFNAALVDALRESADVLFDVAALAQTVGLTAWHSPQQWNAGKLPFDTRFLPLYADYVGRIVGALRGKSRRCLVLDLDNTVWGGVIGDDGVDGIAIGQGDATGEAFLDVQRTALALRDRGIVLAVLSKNDDAIARAPFRERPEMLLREEHFAVFQANWQDKATNLAAIADALCLGLDAMVLLDDNPAERELVRTMLPEVAVPELPDDPALFARVLSAGGYFESVGFSREDRNRAAAYEANARRVPVGTQIGDLDAYLASLQMTIVFAPFDARGRGRIAQLINKSNQFNLTTRRYGELDVAKFETDPDVFTLQVRLLDAFGDNGTIGTVVCRKTAPHEWEIDTWLMSCRVLGRRVEEMVLREILAHARSRGIERLVGTYLPTNRNALVRDHYAKLGFTLIDRDHAGGTTWALDTAHEIEAAPMAVERTGFA